MGQRNRIRLRCFFKESFMAYGKQITKIVYGGDYNPEQWPADVWQEDVRLMKKAHINEVTLNVFNWAMLQPSEEVYDFSKLDEIMALLHAEGFYVCLATSTAAHPAWMAKRHPDILRVDEEGRRRKFGGRHNSCPNSPTYRLYAPRLARKLAQRYQTYDNIIAWHISNEYGGACYCENCERAFRSWLQKKYRTLDALNKSWNTAFWGHTFYDWDEIVLPDRLSEHFDMGIDQDRTMFQGISLDYNRFNSDSILECFLLERKELKEITPDIPVTTNLMGSYKMLDYQKWARYMDFVSWDNYPLPSDSPAQIAMQHDLMRGIGKQNSFVLMEQTPSVTNWQPYNKLKRPGQMRLYSLQAAAHGADAIQFFQIRRSIGACEKFHGAVIDHAGRDDTRVFREVEALGAELSALGDVFLEGRTPAKTAILFDWDNWWATEYSAGPSILLRYKTQIEAFYTALFHLHIPVDIVGCEDDLSDYRLVITPLLYMVKPAYDEKLRAFVEKGGVWITTCFSGMVDENDLVTGAYPGKLRNLLGIWVEESDALPEGEQNTFCYEGRLYPASILCDLLHTEGAEMISVYEEDFYRGMPVITRNRVGKGKAYYVATCSDASFYEAFLRNVTKESGINPPLQAPEEVEVCVRETKKGTVLFLLNHADHEVSISLPKTYTDAVTKKPCSCICMPKWDVRILLTEKNC